MRSLSLAVMFVLSACGPSEMGMTGGGAAGGGVVGGGTASTGGGAGSAGGSTAGGASAGGASAGGAVAGGAAGGSSASGGTATAGGSSSAGGSPTISIPGYDTSCYSQNPTSAAAMVAIVGKTMAAGIATTALGGVTLAFINGAGATVASTTSASNGTFTLRVPTNGVPIEGFVKLTSSGKKETDWYPPGPLAADINAGELTMFDAGALGLLGIGVGASIDTNKSQLFITVEDCVAKPFAGATASVMPQAGVVRYIAGGNPSATAMSTDATGTVFLGNLPVSTATASGMMHGHQLRSRVFTAKANAVIQVSLRF